MFPNLWFCLIRLVRCPVLLAFIHLRGSGSSGFIKNVAKLAETGKVQNYCDSGAALKWTEQSGKEARGREPTT